MKNYLFGYPGNKRDLVKSLNYVGNEFAEFCGGSCSFSIEAIANDRRVVKIAEQDASIRAVLMCCNNKNLYREMLGWVQQMKEILLTDTETTWQKIKSVLDEYDYKNLTELNENQLTRLAAIKILYQQIAHGCIPREHSTGRTLNVIYSKDKFRGLKNWQPDTPYFGDRKSELQIYRDWSEIPVSTETTVFIDPPYYAPGKSPCYRGHKPNKYSTLVAILNMVEKALKENAKLIYLTSYAVDDLCSGVDNLARKYKYFLEIENKGELNTLSRGKGNFKHGRRSENKIDYKECLWILR